MGILIQAAGFAALAALSPAALLIVAVYLGSQRPRLAVLSYLAGGLVTTVIAGIILLIALRSGHLSDQAHRTPRYGLRAGLGLVMIAAAAVLLVRAKRSSRPAPEGPVPEGSLPESPVPPGPPPASSGSKSPAPSGFIGRIVARPGPLTAFVAGMVIFFPSLAFLAAVQVIATAKADLAINVLGIAIVVAIVVACVWLPYVTYLIFPEQTVRRLSAFNSWLRTYGRVIVTACLAVAGVLLTVDGLTVLLLRLRAVKAGPLRAGVHPG